MSKYYEFDDAAEYASVRKYRDINEYLQASKWNSELLEVTA